jgi:hypothetical protein
MQSTAVMNNRLKIIQVFLSIKLTSTLLNREVMGGLEDKFIGSYEVVIASDNRNRSAIQFPLVSSTPSPSPCRTVSLPTLPDILRG